MTVTKPKYCLIYSFIVFLLSGCSLQLVSPYDESTVSRIEYIDRNIEHFYLKMLSVPRTKRLYSNCSDTYLDIDIDIRSFVRRQQIREKNRETTKQSRILESFWAQDIRAHKANTVLSNFIIKRRLDQYRRLMDTLLKGELAKKN